MFSAKRPEHFIKMLHCFLNISEETKTHSILNTGLPFRGELSGLMKSYCNQKERKKNT